MRCDLISISEFLDSKKKSVCACSLVQVQFLYLKALVWFWLIDETLSANLVYQSNYEICSTTPSDEAMVKIMIMVMAW